MRLSMLMCKKAVPILDIPSGIFKLDVPNLRRQKDKVVIVMGATGAGKSRLSIDLATQFHAEIINSDKIQVYEGLEIATNKITEQEQRGVPHHLLGIVDPTADFTATDFCHTASLATEAILSRGNLPMIVGGSNSYMEALFDSRNFKFRSKYECCFLWVDVAMPVLHHYLSERVDKMVESGMIQEVRSFFDANADYRRGIRRAIGVPELDLYLRAEPFLGQKNRDRLLQQAIQEIKQNNNDLSVRQLGKIHRLRYIKNWNIHRINATEVFRRRGKEADEAWEDLVAGPSKEIVKQFLHNFEPAVRSSSSSSSTDYTAECLVA